MSEQEIREGMQLAVWDEPPLDFDPDALIERAQKARSRRRALVSVGVGTALVVVSAFALPMLLTPPGPDSANIAEQPATSATRPSEPAQARDQRLAERIARQMAQVMKSPTRGYGVQLSDGQLSSIPVAEGEKLGGMVHFTDDIGPTAIVLRIGRQPDVGQLCGGAATCLEEPQPDGTTVVLVEYAEGPDIVQATATHLRKDGTAVTFTAYSHNPATGSGYRKTVPLNVSELRVLATDPEIRVD